MQTDAGYMIFVDKVRRYSREQPLEDAVERTIRECMEEDVMADFLKRNRAEIVKSVFMSMTKKSKGSLTGKKDVKKDEMRNE